MIEIIEKYFPHLTDSQKEQFASLNSIYEEWNSKINLISRADMENLYVRHVLHSLTIAHLVDFKKDNTIIDIGTGGGFPGIPLAILFPEVKFTLVDSIGKKIMAVSDIIDQLKLSNAKAINSRAEQIKGNYTYIISRAVTGFPDFVKMTKHLMTKNQGGIIYLKGGEFNAELNSFPSAKVFDIYASIPEPFFISKKIIYLPA